MNIVLNDSQFPAGTTVTAYETGIMPSAGAPAGVNAGSAVVATGTGSLTFTGLNEKTYYIGYASVESKDVYVHFRTGVSTFGLNSFGLFEPAAVGQWFGSLPLAAKKVETKNTENVLLVSVPYYSGPTGITIDKLGCEVIEAAGTSGVTRLGVYKVVEQQNPFAWVAEAVWATLLLDATTVVATATGVKEVTPGTALVIPKNTWFSLAGVDQGSATVAKRLSYAPLASTPLGLVGAKPAVPAAGLSMAAVTGALPASFTPGANVEVECGVIFHRSA